MFTAYCRVLSARMATVSGSEAANAVSDRASSSSSAAQAEALREISGRLAEMPADSGAHRMSSREAPTHNCSHRPPRNCRSCLVARVLQASEL